MGSFWAAALAQVRSWPRDRLFIWLLLGGYLVYALVHPEKF